MELTQRFESERGKKMSGYWGVGGPLTGKKPRSVTKLSSNGRKERKKGGRETICEGRKPYLTLERKEKGKTPLGRKPSFQDDLSRKKPNAYVDHFMHERRGRLFCLRRRWPPRRKEKLPVIQGSGQLFFLIQGDNIR